MSSGQDPWEAVVVGAGHNGLTAAAYLARAGLRTLVLERRDIVGGCCVTEEIHPGCRASTTSYIASMLRPEVIRRAGARRPTGCAWCPAIPALYVPFPDQSYLAWWSDPARTVSEMRAHSEADAARLRRDRRQAQEARALPAAVLHGAAPGRPRPRPRRPAGGARASAAACAGSAATRSPRMITFLTGSLGEFLDRHYESEKVKTLILANSVYGKHGGPYQPGTAIGLLFHLLSSGDHAEQGFYGHVIGGMGSITQALARRRPEARRRDPHERAGGPHRRARRAGSGVVLEDGTRSRARLVVSNADPEAHFPRPARRRGRCRPSSARRCAAIRMDGPCAKVNLVLVRGAAGQRHAARTGRRASARSSRWCRPWSSPSAATTSRSSARCPRSCGWTAWWPRTPTTAWRPPGKHVMTCFVQYVPYKLKQGTWDEKRERLGDRVVRKIGEYAPNVPGSILARQVLTPLDLERTYGLTEGNIFHGDLALDQLFFMRPGARLVAVPHARRRASTCAARGRTRAAASRARPGATRPGRSSKDLRKSA